MLIPKQLGNVMMDMSGNLHSIAFSILDMDVLNVLKRKEAQMVEYILNLTIGNLPRNWELFGLGLFLKIVIPQRIGNAVGGTFGVPVLVISAVARDVVNAIILKRDIPNLIIGPLQKRRDLSGLALFPIVPTLKHIGNASGGISGCPHIILSEAMGIAIPVVR